MDDGGLRDDGGLCDGERPADGPDALHPARADPRCPICVTLGALPWPEGIEGRGGDAAGEAVRLCPAHLRLWRVLQCRGWNADAEHQALAGRASWAAFSARWRAGQGLPPLSVEDARRYVSPDMIGHLGMPLPSELRAAIHRAWCAGQLLGVPAWLANDPPPDPAGLWSAGGEGR